MAFGRRGIEAPSSGKYLASGEGSKKAKLGVNLPTKGSHTLS